MKCHKFEINVFFLRDNVYVEIISPPIFLVYVRDTGMLRYEIDTLLIAAS